MAFKTPYEIKNCKHHKPYRRVRGGCLFPRSARWALAQRAESLCASNMCKVYSELIFQLDLGE